MKRSINLATGTLTTAVKNALSNDYNLNVRPVLTVDWNLNCYVQPYADNVPPEDDESFDSESFPAESMIEPIRPTKGINKARVNQSIVADGYDRPDKSKFYISDPADPYKYWTSPFVTGTGGNFPLHTDGLSTARPYVVYPKVMQSNKIVIKVENTWASPKNFQIQTVTTLAATNWGSVGPANPPIENDGTITLYYNGNGWVSTRPANLVTTPISGIMLNVTSMGPGIEKTGAVTKYIKATYNLASPGTWGNRTTLSTTGANSSLNVISIEAHYEENLSARLIGLGDDFELSADSQLYPLGTITTNQASITLSNEDGVFNKNNVDSPYYGLTESNAEVTVDYIYTISGVEHSVRQFKLLTELWSEGDGQVDVSLEDSSKWLKTIKPRPTLYENKSVTEIIWRVLDSVGFNNYVIQEEDRVVDHIVPFFWSDGEQTVWEILDSLSTGTQTAIYFDYNNRLQVKTREAAFRDAETPSWTLTGEQLGDKLADIVSIETSSELEANKIDVKFKSTKWAVARSGVHALEKVWEPEGDTVTVRSSPLRLSLDALGTTIVLEQSEARLWPFKSKVMINGEIIQYEGKRYTYLENGISKYVTLKSDSERYTYDRKTTLAARRKNHYTGALQITERGVWNTDQRAHLVDVNGYTTTASYGVGGGVGVTRPGSPGLYLNKERSTVTINTPSGMSDYRDIFIAKRGTTNATAYNMYGTKVMFTGNDSQTTKRAGMAFFLANNGDGYYVEISPTSTVTDRSNRNEVILYSVKNGKTLMLDTGVPIAVINDRFYEIDIFVKGTTQHTIGVWVNGRKVCQATTGTAERQIENAQLAMFARGKTAAEYEYLYAVNRSTREPVDDFGFYDLKYGAVRGGRWERELLYELNTRWTKIKKKKNKRIKKYFSEYFFDEFGPYVHEIREYDDVKFESGPVQYSYLFSTNNWYATTLEYRGSPFDASFIVANTGRQHAILKGEDNLLFGGAGAGVNQVFTVLGRTLEIKEESSVKRENKLSIRKNGPIESELSSDWIQSRAMALDIGQWMATHWSEGIDEQEAEIFGNPLIEIGDIVEVQYARKDMFKETHKYFVTKTSNSFENGVKTNLTLRRVRSATTIS